MELPRLNLTFTVENDEGNIHLASREYKGMIVAEEQHIGTLVGLVSGLVLRSRYSESQSSCLLLPHGTPRIKRGKNDAGPFWHQKVEMDTRSLNTPAVFVYRIDHILRQLRGEESLNSWLMLAYLHGCTSYLLPDPFTGSTGTERMIQILESGMCYQSRPLDERGISLLRAIAKLTPVRNYYPKHLKRMQSISWPPVHSLAAHDAAYSLSVHIYQASQRFARFSEAKGTEDVKGFVTKHDKELTVRSYWRSAEAYGEDTQLHNNFVTLVGAKPGDREYTGRHIVTGTQNLNASRSIAQIVYDWQPVVSMQRPRLRDFISGEVVFSHHLGQWRS